MRINEVTVDINEILYTKQLLGKICVYQPLFWLCGTNRSKLIDGLGQVSFRAMKLATLSLMFLKNIFIIEMSDDKYNTCLKLDNFSLLLNVMININCWFR